MLLAFLALSALLAPGTAAASPAQHAHHAAQLQAVRGARVRRQQPLSAARDGARAPTPSAAPALFSDLLRHAVPLPLPARTRPAPGSASGGRPGARVLVETDGDTVEEEAGSTDAPAFREAFVPPELAQAREGSEPAVHDEDGAAEGPSDGAHGAADGQGSGEEAGAAAGRAPRQLGSVSRVDSGWLFPASATVKLVFTTNDGRLVMCSGSLMSAFHVLTAGHCVIDGSGARYPIDSYFIVPGQGDVAAPKTSDGWSRMYTDKPFGIARATQSTVWGYNRASAPFAVDYAVLTLDRPIGLRAGSLGLAFSPLVGDVLSQRGYPGTGGYTGVLQYARLGYPATTVEPGCEEMLSDMPICAGDSGSPVYDGANRAVGVAVGMYYTSEVVPECSGTRSTLTSAKRLSRSAFDKVQALLASQAAAPSWRAAVYERFYPGAAASAGSGVAAPGATAGAATLASLKGVGALVRAADGRLTVPVWWSLWNQGGVASGAIDFTIYYTRDPTDVSAESYVPLTSGTRAAGIGANGFAAFNASVPAPPASTFGAFYLTVYYTFVAAGYREDFSARVVVLGRVVFPAPDDFVCGSPARALAGASGSFSGSTASDSARAQVLPVTCPRSVAGVGAAAPTPVARADIGQVWLSLDLGLTPATAGGTLTLSTCAPGTRFNTVLWAGTSSAPSGACPTLPSHFTCRGYDDDGSCAGGGGVPGSVGTSTLVMSVPGTQRVYVLVSGAPTEAAGQSHGSFTLTWSYRAPSPSRSAQRTRTVSRSRSRSRKAK